MFRGKCTRVGGGHRALGVKDSLRRKMLKLRPEELVCICWRKHQGLFLSLLQICKPSETHLYFAYNCFLLSTTLNSLASKALLSLTSLLRRENPIVSFQCPGLGFFFFFKSGVYLTSFATGEKKAQVNIHWKICLGHTVLFEIMEKT